MTFPNTPEFQLYISTCCDINIFHIYQMEILEIQRLLDKGIQIHHLLLTNFDPNLQVHEWRVHILQFLVKNIYVNNNHIKHAIVKNAPREVCCLFHPIMLQVHFKWTKYCTPVTIQDKPNINMIRFFEYLKQQMSINCNLKDIIFVNRKNARKVLDLATKQPLENILSKAGIVCKYFEDLTANEQCKFISQAKIFISPHGSGLTNMIFTHPNCKNVEISYRKYFFCDPICEKHRNETLLLKEDCFTKTPFYKYDYFHQARLLNKQHYEYMADDCLQEMNISHNNNKTMLVNSMNFINFIKTLL